MSLFLDASVKNAPKSDAVVKFLRVTWGWRQRSPQVMETGSRRRFAAVTNAGNGWV
jgi:hypothetical protein